MIVECRKRDGPEDKTVRWKPGGGYYHPGVKSRGNETDHRSLKGNDELSEDSILNGIGGNGEV